jgi:hypothetical protein
METMSWTDAFTTAAESRNLGLHSFVALKGGEQIEARWWEPYRPDEIHQLYSLSKSFTATAAGIAIGEGRFSLDDAVVDFFPDERPQDTSENLAAMRVRDLLTMTSGHTEEPWSDEPDWVRSFLHAPIEKAPGSHFLYNSLATYVVGRIVARTTGERLLDYLGPRLLDPLEIVGATWEQCPQGFDTAGWGLSVTTGAIARFGELYRLDGVWKGSRLLPEGWVGEATRSHIENGDPASPSDWSQGYGFQFWRCRHGAYRGDGAFGQFCVVHPQRELVVAITAGTGNMGAVLDALWESLDGAASGATPAALSVPHPVGAATSPSAVETIWTIDENPAGITEIGLAFEEGGALFTLSDRWGTHAIAIGLNGWRAGETTYHPARTETQPTAAWGAWNAPNVFAFKLCYTRHPATPLFTLTLDGEKLTLERDGHLGIGSEARLTLTGQVR